MKKSETTRTLQSKCHLNTYSESWKPNVLSDGTKIDSLPCSVTIYCISEKGFPLGEGEEFLLFYNPVYSSEHDYIPAGFHLQVYLSALAFNELWQTVQENRHVVFHGEIDRAHLTETSHNPIRGGSTYEWDISDKMKIVSSLSFRMANPSEVRDSPPTKLEEECKEKYKEHSQMRRLSLEIARQTENEAERRGVEMEHSNFVGSPAVMFYLEFLYETQTNDKQELWRHLDSGDTSEGRRSDGNCSTPPSIFGATGEFVHGNVG